MSGTIIDRTLPPLELQTKKIKTFFTKGLISLEVKPIGSIRCEQRLKQSSIGLYLRLNSRPKKLKLSLPLLEKQH
jgi:hypothetical protein